MTHFKTISLAFFVLVLGGATSFAQESLQGLFYNPLLQKTNTSTSNNKHIQSNISLQLPFIEDFSVNTFHPDNHKWSDRNVFINKDFPVEPPNTGVATFDVLDASGRMYSYASSLPFVADMLSSRPIRTDSVFGLNPRALSPADSLYFSFYYQPQGLGDKPETDDSLVLQFGYPTGNMVFDYMDSITVPADQYLFDAQIDQINPLDTIYAPEGCASGLYIISNRIYTWGDDIVMPCDSVFKPEMIFENAWSTIGSSLQDFENEFGSDFRQILLPLKDEKYFSNAFQFRFFNYGSIAGPNQEAAGNVDQWNVDFIVLNEGRSYNDSSYNKVSFSGKAPSFLKRYETMPYKHYRSAPTNAVKAEINLKITNLSNENKNTHYRYTVDQAGGDQHFEWDGGFCNLPPFQNFGYQNCDNSCGAKHACPPLVSLFALDFERDTASFVVKHFISDSSATPPLVDSLVYRQGFYNYFAYDDGTPEAGYSIEPSGALLAMQFSTNVLDTLSHIQILFNRTNDESSNKYFDLIVWGDNNGIPGAVRYRKIRQKPEYEDQRYAFSTYELDEPLIVNGNFYIGIMRETGVVSMGFDRVNNAKNYLFYNINGDWVNSNLDGALMIRAVTGKGKPIGLSENHSQAPAYRLYPNPANHILNIEAGTHDPKPSELLILDFTGRVIRQQHFSTQLDISELQAGLYIIVIQKDGKVLQTSKILKN